MYTYEGYGVKVVRESRNSLEKDTIGCPQDAVEIVQRSIGNEDREVFVAILLDTRHHVIGINTVAIGTLNACLVHPREVYKVPILMGADALIICHNHPSGDDAPSREDIELTKRLYTCGEMMGIGLLDHIVLTPRTSLSLRETGHFPVEVKMDWWNVSKINEQSIKGAHYIC